MSQEPATRPPRRGARSQSTGYQSRLRAWGRHHRRMSGQSAGRLLRYPFSSLLTMLAIAIALILPTGLWLVLDSARLVNTQLDASATLTVYLDKELTETQVVKIAGIIAEQPRVGVARLIGADQGMREFEDSLGLEDALSRLEINPLPASVVVTPSDSGPQTAHALAQRLGEIEGVDEVRFDLAWLERLQRLAALGKRLVLALGVLFGLGVLLIVGNTIRLAVESRRQEIQVVTLIGATHGFVRRPFLYSGAWYGLGGGLLAWLLLNLGGQWLAVPISALAESYGANYQLPRLGFQGSAILLICSTMLGLLGAWLAVGRHLADSRPR
ncbi:FtsX-like permease family protein [Pistricoccus aurantiacus]|uniref:Cell division protein FtsX n=1 Tax=Pistricoccus aurantiacus TaxID=1883414 RepID=A0A5B8SNJ0_9GAMM|nr:permease-like cell division protein FtsX [Pistricoccus aurantiacus]QEA38752.1 FtsX-like permease family protein [Pistricoccus aurantiacus]